MERLDRSAVLTAVVALATVGIAAIAILAIPGEPSTAYRAAADAAQVVGVAAGMSPSSPEPGLLGRRHELRASSARRKRSARR